LTEKKNNNARKEKIAAVNDRKKRSWTERRDEGIGTATKD
jgi:hypothetical protein